MDQADERIAQRVSTALVIVAAITSAVASSSGTSSTGTCRWGSGTLGAPHWRCLGLR